MNEAHARNMRTTELVAFAEQELDMLQLVLAHPPAAVTELVKRVHDIAVKAEAHDALVEEYGDAMAEKLDTVKELVNLFDAKDIYLLATELKALKDVMVEFDLADAHDLDQELKRLKKFAQRIEDACNDAGIEINC